MINNLLIILQINTLHNIISKVNLFCNLIKLQKRTARVLLAP